MDLRRAVVAHNEGVEAQKFDPYLWLTGPDLDGSNPTDQIRNTDANTVQG